jgi:serine protease Do
MIIDIEVEVTEGFPDVFKAENKTEPDTSKYVKVETLKISVRDLNKDDISDRKLPKNTSGVVVTEISAGSPLMFVSVNDIIVELQKKKVRNSNQFSDLVKEIIDKGEKTLYLAIYNSSNQRSYITVKMR